MIYEYYQSVIFVIIVTLISFLLVYVNELLVNQEYDSEKSSVYECGFQPIDMNLQQFEIKFYIVGLLFLIFDIEIVFLLPFINIIYALNFYNIFCFLIFMVCFFLTFLYEWKNKFLTWS